MSKKYSITELSQKINSNNIKSEEDVRQYVNALIKQEVYSEAGISININNEVKNSAGFIDSEVNDVIIEYKAPSVDIYKHEEQLKSYMHDSYHNIFGILTNGQEVSVYIKNTPSNEIEPIKSMTGPLNEKNFNQIIKSILKKDRFILDEYNVESKFGLSNDSVREIIRDLYKLINIKQESTRFVFDEWLRLMHLSNSDIFVDSNKKEIKKFYENLLDTEIDSISKEYIALFSVHSYYAFFAKVVAYIYICNTFNQPFLYPTTDVEILIFFDNLNNGAFFRKFNIMNFGSEPFYDWYCNEKNISLMRKMLELVVDVDMVSSNKNNYLMVHFYEKLFPFHVRHAMGEFYTPKYLANHVVSKAFSECPYKLPNSFLDPTCGSGIFLIEAIKTGIVDVYGVDINPLAVLTSKVTFLLNKFGKNMSNPITENCFEIPIYLGDSTYFPQELLCNGIDCLEYEFLFDGGKGNKINVILPKDAVEEEYIFDRARELDLILSDKSKPNSHKREEINKVLQQHQQFCYQELSSSYENLLDSLFLNPSTLLNGSLFTTVVNYFKTALIKNIDIIAGNPPWVRWSNLPTTYKETIKAKCSVDGLFSSDTNTGGVDLNIYALIASINIRERLSKDGICGLLMPDTWLYNPSLEGFRNMYVGRKDKERFYLKDVVLWDGKEKPFDGVQLSFGEFYFSFQKNEDREIKIESKRYLEQDLFLAQISPNCNNFTLGTKESLAAMENLFGSNSYTFRKGTSLVKGFHYVLEYVDKASDESSLFRYQISQNKFSEEIIELENACVAPYLKAPDLTPGIVDKNSLFCLFPYEYGHKDPYDWTTLKDKFRLTFDYISRDEIKKDIRGGSKYNERVQKPKTNIGITRVGEYSFFDQCVAFRDNTKFFGSIVKKIKCPWGEYKTPVLDGHISFLSRDLDNSQLSMQECERICAIFNKKEISEYVKSSASTRSFSIKIIKNIKLDKEVYE